MSAETDVPGYKDVVTPPMTQEDIANSLEELLEAVRDNGSNGSDQERLIEEPAHDSVGGSGLSMEQSEVENVDSDGQLTFAAVASNIAERYIKTNQVTPDTVHEPVRESEYDFAKAMINEATPVGKPDEEGFYQHYKIGENEVVDGGDIAILKKMLARKASESDAADDSGLASAATSESVKTGNQSEEVPSKRGNADRRRPPKPRPQPKGDNGDKMATPAAIPTKPGKRTAAATEKENQAPGEAANSEPETNGGTEYVGSRSERRALKAARNAKPAADAESVADQKNDDVDGTPLTTAGYLHLKQGGDENNIDDWVYGGPTEAPRAMEAPKPGEEEPLVTDGYVHLKQGGDIDNIDDWEYGGPTEVPLATKAPKPAEEAMPETTVETEPVTEDNPDDEPDAPLVVEGEVVGVEDRPLGRGERMRSAAKKIATVLAESGVFKAYENDKPKEKDPDSLGRRIKERTLDLANRARYGALPTALALRDTLANAYGSPDGSGRADRITDLFRKRNEDGELGEISTGKVVAAAAGVLALYASSRLLGEIPSGMGGINLSHGADTASNMSAGKGGYNPYAGGSIGRGGISAESAVPQGSGRLVNHPNVGDIIPEATPGAPKFNDEQLSNYTTLHAGQRVDTAGEGLQDMLRKNGVAANRKQFSALLQVVLKHDADVHQFTEGKTYDPTSMPDGYRFYWMDMDDIMRRLDELK